MANPLPPSISLSLPHSAPLSACYSRLSSDLISRRDNTMTRITIKGRKLYRGAEVVGEITGWRQMTAKWGATGPGYGFKLINGRECVPCYAYFDETVRAAKAEAARLMPSDDQFLAALGPCGR